MTEFIWINSKQIPIIRIGKGSSKFYGNLIRSYTKNYDTVHVFAYDTRVNLSIWLIFNMSTEFLIDNIIISWNNNQPTLSFLVHKDRPPVDIYTIDLSDGDFYIKYGKKTDLDMIKRILFNKTHASIICAGASCVNLLAFIPFLYTIGFIYYNVEVVRTYDNNGHEKAGIKVSIIPCNYDMLEMQQ